MNQAAGECQVLVLDERDNVGVALADLPAGRPIRSSAGPLTPDRDIPLGHKIALRDIPQDQKVYKYGAPIGSAKSPIAAGQHVHTHNLRSDYLPTFTLDGANPYHREAHP